MFFRLKTTKSGNVLKLLESYRDTENIPRHCLVASFGDAPLPKHLWKIVAKEVEERLEGQTCLFSKDLDEEAARWVDRIVLQVRREGKWKPAVGKKAAQITDTTNAHKTTPSTTAEEPSPSEEELYLDGVCLNKIEHTEDVPLGPVLVGWQAWQELEMDDLLENLRFNKSQRNNAAISVINRLCDPVSENGLPLWYQQSGLADIMEYKLPNEADDRFYRVSDLLHKNCKSIEAHLRKTQPKSLGFERTMVLYDLTNTHFEGACRENAKALYGRNKQKRNDCPQVVIAMIFDNEGFELAHEVFEGNMNDSKSLSLMMASLNACVEQDDTLAALKPLVIMDGGIATKANLALLRTNGFRYLVNESRRSRTHYREQFEQKKDFSPLPSRPEGKEVWVRVEKVLIPAEPIPPKKNKESAVVVPSENIEPSNPIEITEESYEERRVFCYSAERAKKELSMMSKAEDRFIAALNKLKKSVVAGNIKSSEACIKAITRLQTQHKRVKRFYKIEQVGQDKKITDITWERLDQNRDQADDLCGCYVLRTNAPELSDNEIWNVYMTLTKAEDGFRCLKSDLGLRPNYHHIAPRVDGHIFICVLAYHLLCHQLYKLGKVGDHREWSTLKRILETHTYATIHVPLKDGTLHCLRKAGLPDAQQENIYKSLGIKYKKLPSTHTVVMTEDRKGN